MVFGLTESSPAWLGGDSTCEILTCCAGDAIPAGGSWAASALRRNGRSRRHSLRLCSVPTSRSLAFGCLQHGLGGSLKCNARGGCSGGSPAGMTALRLCSRGRRKGPCHQYSDTCLQVTPTMDVVLPVLQDTASVSFEEGVSEVPFPSNPFEGNFAELDLWVPL